MTSLRPAQKALVMTVGGPVELPEPIVVERKDDGSLLVLKTAGGGKFPFLAVFAPGVWRYVVSADGRSDAG